VLFALCFYIASFVYVFLVLYVLPPSDNSIAFSNDDDNDDDNNNNNNNSLTLCHSSWQTLGNIFCYFGRSQAGGLLHLVGRCA
jgi:hypothetical protein